MSEQALYSSILPTPIDAEPFILPAEVSATVKVGGKPWEPPAEKPCTHETFGVDYEIHRLVLDNDDPQSPRVGVRVAVKAMCLECGVRCTFDPASLQMSTDGSNTKAALWITPEGGW